MNTPFLVQRCFFSNNEPWRLGYDYMGSVEFEVGGQPKSLKRLFEQEFATFVFNLSTDSGMVPVYMLGKCAKDLEEYAKAYLAKLAEGKIRLKEWTRFGDAIKDPSISVNVWFDFENDVLWTIDERIFKELQEELLKIKNHWSKKS